MWRRFTFYDVRIIGHYLGMLIMYSCILMVIPVIIGIIFGEWEPVNRYFFSIGITLFIGSLLRFCYIQPPRLNSQQAMAVVGLSWIVLAMLCSIPLYLSGHYLNYLDAVFDGVSGLTTTGASLVQDLDHLSYADNMFRFMMHLLGGLGLIVVALSLGIFGKRAGSTLFRSEGRSEHVVPNVINTTRFIAKVTSIIIVVSALVIFVLMIVSGIEPARAFLQGLWVSISGFATGGFTPMQQSILYYHSMPLESLLMILMIMGSISFVLYSELWKGQSKAFFKDIETRTAIIWISLMVVVFTASSATSTLFSDLPTLLRRGIFMVISSFTTTGFSVITVNQLVTVLTSGAFLTLALIMAIGGGAGSTSGGIKLYRIGMIAKSIVSTVKQAVSPDSAKVTVSYYHIGRRVLSPDIVKEAMTVFILYVITYVVGALVGIAHGYDATLAIFESVAMTSNGGIITGIASPGMPATLEIFYIFQMWVGRLEFVTFLALAAQVISSIIPRSGASKFEELRRMHDNMKTSSNRKRSDAKAQTRPKILLSIALALVVALPLWNIDLAHAAEMDNSVNPTQLPDSSFIYDASISDLEHADPYMDQQTVQVVGEVVGDRITSEFDPKFAWITLQAVDGSYAEVSLYMPMSYTEMIDTYGSYAKQGTKIQARGTFNLACVDHQGLSDLHVENMSLVSQGAEFHESISMYYSTAGFLLIVASVVCFFIFQRIREREM